MDSHRVYSIISFYSLQTGQIRLCLPVLIDKGLFCFFVFAGCFGLKFGFIYMFDLIFVNFSFLF